MRAKDLDLPETPATPGAIRRDLLLLLGLGLLVLGAGLGMRDPWPADEPRFALVARDMVANGQWLFPSVGADWYPDKPPLFFWTIATFLALTGSLRLAFLLPSLLAGLGTLWLVYDLGRRLWDRGVGLTAGFALLFTVQFSLQAHLAQIDAMLCFWTTLSFYCLCRHLLLGEGWKWYAFGGFAAGLGVITKGVGFLPLLLLLPYAILRRRRWPLPRLEPAGWRWSIAPATMLLAIALWFVPMWIVVAASGDPQLAAYRDEILFHQTVTRYSAAWHHAKPLWYYLEAMLTLWVPLILLVPWLIPRWRERWRERDARVALLLGWVIVVLVFFSASPGKRGVYILPALPALAIVCAPWLRGLAQRPDVQRTLFGFTVLLVIVFAAAFVWLQWIQPERMIEVAARTGVRNLLPLIVIALLGVAALRYWGVERAPQAWATFLAIVWLISGWWIMPSMNGVRSARNFTESLERAADPDRELGLLAYKEQFLLYLQRPSVNFGHARWREESQEAFDAAAWLAADPRRQLLVPDQFVALCFAPAKREEIGEASDQTWWLVSGAPDSHCVGEGDLHRARTYTP
jgi:4-amino-4-deoxy-L-arabinose transferase-like glycosyltransferase